VAGAGRGGIVEQQARWSGAQIAVREIAYDHLECDPHIALRLKDEGAAMVGFRQDFRSMAPPTGEFAKLIRLTLPRP
jgi:phage terminase large subunit-like protein